MKTRILSIVLLGLLITAVPAASQRPLQRVDSDGFGGCTLLDVVTLSSGTLVACGDRNTVIRSVDDGQTWQRIQTPATFLTTFHACAALQNSVWCVGEGGTAIRSTDDGQTWQLAPSFGADVYDVAARGSAACAVGAGGRTWLSTDAGQTWALHQLPSTDTVTLYGVTIREDQTVVAVGEGSTIASRASNANAWTISQLEILATLRSIAYATNPVGYVVATSAVLRTTDGGATWTPIFIAPESDADVESLVNIYVTQDRKAIVTGSTGGALLLSTGTGSMAPISTSDSTQLLSVTRTSGAIVAVGADGRIARSSDADGSSWTDVGGQYSPLLLTVAHTPTQFSAAGTNARLLLNATAAPLTCSSCPTDSALLGSAVGPFGTIVSVSSGGAYRSNDGSMWERIPTLDGYHLTALRAYGSTVWGAGRSSIVRSTDGQTFAQVAQVANGSFTGVASNQQGTVVASLFTGGLLRSTNDGTTWNDAAAPDNIRLTDVACAGPNEFIAVGVEGTFLRSVDGGQTFSRDVAIGRHSMFTSVSADVSTGSVAAVTTEGDILYRANRDAPWQLQRTATVLSSVSVAGNTLFAVGAGGSVFRIDMETQTSIGYTAPSRLHVRPNPANGPFIVSIPPLTSRVELRIVSTSGSTLYVTSVSDGDTEVRVNPLLLPIGAHAIQLVGSNGSVIAQASIVLLR